MPIKINVPVYTGDNEGTKLSLGYYLFGELAKEHTAKGAEFKAGTITPAEWDAYKKDVFDVRVQAIGDFIAEEKVKAKATTFHSSNGVVLNDMFEDI